VKATEIGLQAALPDTTFAQNKCILKVDLIGYG
jgi:hypothetical protein